MNIAQDQIDRMKMAANVTKDSELAAILGEKPTTLSSWKKRGIPGGKLYGVADILNCSADWIRKGEGEMSAKGDRKAEGHIDPELAQAIAKKIKAKFEDKAIELTGEELMAVQMLRDLSDHDRQRIMHTLQMAWTAGKVGK